MSIDHIEELNKSIDDIEHVKKHNPYHGKDGRFTSAPGGGGSGAMGGTGGASSGAKNGEKSGKKNSKEPTEKVFSYNNKRCHATIIPGMKKEHLVGDKKKVGEMDGYEIYQIPSALFDQHGFIGIKKSVEDVDHIQHVEKFNPFHDRLGRFSTSHGMASYSANPKTTAGQKAIGRSDFAGYGHVMNVHRESKGENIRQNQNWITTGQKPKVPASQQQALTQRRIQRQAQRQQATAAAGKQTAQTKPKTQTQQQQQAAQNQQQAAQTKTVHVNQKMRSGITMDVDFDQSKVAGALNKEFKGTAKGKDLTGKFDATNLTASDSYQGRKRYTNQVADMQGFNSPAKKVSKAEFDQLAKACGDEFYRTVGASTVNGKNVTAKGMKNAYTTENDLSMNGFGGRVYGDGIYTVSAKMTAGRGKTYTQADATHAKKESQWYGDGRTTLRMTWLSKPKIATESQIDKEWNKLSSGEKAKYGNHANTYACAKGYDAVYTSSGDYMTVFNRSKIAVCDD